MTPTRVLAAFVLLLCALPARASASPLATHADEARWADALGLNPAYYSPDSEPSQDFGGSALSDSLSFSQGNPVVYVEREPRPHRRYWRRHVYWIVPLGIVLLLLPTYITIGASRVTVY